MTLSYPSKAGLQADKAEQGTAHTKFHRQVFLPSCPWRLSKLAQCCRPCSLRRLQRKTAATSIFRAYKDPHLNGNQRYQTWLLMSNRATVVIRRRLGERTWS